VNLAIPLLSDRLLPVASDNMAPTLITGRHMIAVRPVTAFDGEGIYIVDGLARRCERHCGSAIDEDYRGPPRIWASSDNKIYGTWRCTDAEFAQAVSGKVVAVIELLEHAHRDQLWGVVTEYRRAA
jgi:hypothetical protein